MTRHLPLRGLGKLTWLEMKIFVREPMGLIGSVVIPVLMFLVLGRTFGPRLAEAASPTTVLLRTGLPVFVAVFIAISAVLSLVAIIAIYREGGILKRLRATPLSPVTILVTHVLVKLVLTAVTVLLMVLAGRRYYPAGADVPLLSFTAALLFSTWSILSIGFIIASLVRTARFAPPLGSLALYSMLPFCGLFVPIGRAAARHAGDLAGDSADLCRVPAVGHLAGRPVVGPRGRRRRAARRLRRVHPDRVAGLSLGMKPVTSAFRRRRPPVGDPATPRHLIPRAMRARSCCDNAQATRRRSPPSSVLRIPDRAAEPSRGKETVGQRSGAGVHPRASRRPSATCSAVIEDASSARWPA